MNVQCIYNAFIWQLLRMDYTTAWHPKLSNPIHLDHIPSVFIYASSVYDSRVELLTFFFSLNWSTNWIVCWDIYFFIFVCVKCIVNFFPYNKCKWILKGGLRNEVISAIIFMKSNNLWGCGSKKHCNISVRKKRSLQ